jgi:hypothetical protein
MCEKQVKDNKGNIFSVNVYYKAFKYTVPTKNYCNKPIKIKMHKRKFLMKLTINSEGIH